MNPLNEPMKVRACPSRHAYFVPLACMPQQRALVACGPLPAVSMTWEPPVACICVGGAAPLRRPLGGDGGQLL